MLSALVVSFNRREALRRTLRELAALGPLLHEIIVADNASADGSAAMVQDEFPAARLVQLPSNTGVDAFNTAAGLARGDHLLILDDDAWPEASGLRAALALLDTTPEVAAVALAPVHPATRACEWPFARAAVDRFPIMGCGNLIRAAAWREAGGYEPSFFLYRNDTDLALKLLALGHHVRYDPAWQVWHDSPAAARKSERWLELATRNWLWMCRRHGEGLTALAGMAAGCARGLRHAGPSARRVLCVLRGACHGVTDEPAPSGVPVGALGALLRLRLWP